eukprot:gene22612-27292_t
MPELCQFLSDQVTFGLLPCVCRELRDAILREGFCRDRETRFPKLKMQEHFPVTLNTRIQHAGELLYCGLEPPRDDFLKTPEDPSFRYDAGPISARYPLQVYRSGSPYGKGFGLRALTDVEQHELVCVYWGQVVSDADCPLPLQASGPGVDTAPTVGSRYDMKYALRVTRTGADRFWILAAEQGNVARWINHSKTAANLYPEVMEWPEQGLSATSSASSANFPLVTLRAQRHISAGEELLWNYASDSQGDYHIGFWKAPVETAGILKGPVCPEMLRTVSDNMPHVAFWMTEYELSEGYAALKDSLIVPDIAM